MNTPPSPRPHEAGLTLVETLITATVSVIGVAAVTLSIAANLRNQTEQTQTSASKASIRRIVDNLNVQVQNGTMVGIRTGTSEQANILFIDENSVLNIANATGFSSANASTFTSGRGTFATGDLALMTNTNGDAVLFQVTEDISTNDPTRILKHDGCPNTIAYTPGTRIYKANTFAFALGRQINADYTADSLYQQRNGGSWEEVAYKLSDFNIKYGYTATDGSTGENLATQSGAPANAVNRDGRDYRLSHLSLQLAQSGLVGRAYNATVPLQTSRLRVNTIRQCGAVAAMTGTNAGGLRVLVNAPGQITPAVQVTGPDSFTQTLGGTSPDAAPWNNLAPGEYSAAASEISSGNTVWVPEVLNSPAGVTSWTGSTITVQYNPALAPLTVNVSGLPSDLKGRVTLTARSIDCPEWSVCIRDPNNPGATLREGQSITLDLNGSQSVELAPGTYTVGVAAVQSSAGKLYGPTPEPPATITLASRTPSSLDVTYAEVNGGLLVQYYGKPNEDLIATVRGPNGFTQDITLPNGGSRLFGTAAPGAYNVSGTTSAGAGLAARSAVVYPGSRATIVMRDTGSLYVCPNGQTVPGPEFCPRCADGSLTPASGRCPDGDPLCPDGSVAVNGRCPTNIPENPGGSVNDFERCNGGPIMCIDGDDTKAIGGNVYVEVNGERIYLSEYDTYGTMITLPDGRTMKVEELLSDYPTSGGDILTIQNRADYAVCNAYSCQQNNTDPSDNCVLYGVDCAQGGSTQDPDPVDSSDPYNPDPNDDPGYTSPAPGDPDEPADPTPPADSGDDGDDDGGYYNPINPYPDPN